jgi:hypothetical protein
VRITVAEERNMNANVEPSKTISLDDFTTRIAAQMNVYAKDHGLAGRVEEVEAETQSIKLNRDAGGRSHWIPMSLVILVDSEGVHLQPSMAQLREQWSQ